LTPLSSPAGIEFLECPKCYRHYARKPGGALTFRWLHPVSLPLYTVLFVTNPLQRAPEVAKQFVSQRSVEELNRIAEEIELELKHPTQNVREILDNPQTEDQCRAFLEAFVRCVRNEIGRVRQ
jgi:hypothetical protein